MSQEDLQAALDHAREKINALLDLHVAASQAVLPDASTAHQKVRPRLTYFQ